MLEDLVHVVDLMVCWLFGIWVVVSFDRGLLDVVVRFGVLSGCCLGSLLGVLHHVLDGVLQPRAPVDVFLGLGWMMLSSLVFGFRVGLRVGFCCVIHAVVLHPIVNNANPRLEGSTCCSIGGVCLFVGGIHGIAFHSFHGEVFAVRVLLHC